MAATEAGQLLAVGETTTPARGGRVDIFYTKANFHHAYDLSADKWETRAPLPTARSGQGAVLYRGKIFCLGGEGSHRVFGQNEAYYLAADS